MFVKVRVGTSVIKEREIKVLFFLAFPLFDPQLIDMALNNYDIILHSKKNTLPLRERKAIEFFKGLQNKRKVAQSVFSPLRAGYGQYGVPFHLSVVLILI